MPLTPFDVENLENSIRGVGQSIAARRVEQQNRAHQIAQENLAEQRNEAQQAHYNAMETHYGQMESDQQAHFKSIEDKAGLNDAFKRMIEAGNDLKGGMTTLAQQVNSGSMDPDTASSYVQSAIDGQPDDIKKGLLGNPALRSAYDGTLDWSVVGGQQDNAPQPYSVQMPDGKTVEGTYNRKTGHFVPNGPSKPIKVGEQTDAAGNKKFLFGDPNTVTQGGGPAPAFSLVRDANGNLVPAGQAAQTPTVPSLLQQPQNGQ